MTFVTTLKVGARKMQYLIKQRALSWKTWRLRDCLWWVAKE